MAYTGIVVVIPTRNRSAIAMNAIRSVLDQPVANLDVLVSDNSTSEAEREALATFCSTQRDKRLRYVRPPQPLPMADHWEWALQEALVSYSASHVTYLTDRMMFRNGALADALTAVAQHPDKVISYNLDRIVDHVQPIRVEQYAGTGRLLEIETLNLSRLLAQAIFHPSLPRMLNCIAPREIFDRMRKRFGNVFLSIAPDFRFCCRCLDLEETILFYDKSLLFHYALDRSNGASVSRGEATADAVDFTANLPVDNSQRNYATPLPQLITSVNLGFHEYCLFKQETNSPRFFELDRQKYFQANANELQEFTDPVQRAEALALLMASGYEAPAGEVSSVSPAVPFAQRLRSKFKRVATSSSTTGAWLLLARTTGITPPGENSFEFAKLDEAIDYARNVSHGNLYPQLAHDLIQAREVSLAGNGSHPPANFKHVVGSVIPLALRRMVHDRKNQRTLAALLRTKQRFRAERKSGVVRDLPQGVNLVAYIRADMGLGTAARGMAAAFTATGIPFNVINLEHGNEGSHSNQSWAHKEVQHSRYDTTIVCVNPDNSFNLRTLVSPEILGDRYVIANWYWELPEMPDEWLAEFEYADEVWAASNFIREAIASKAPVPVLRVPAVVQLSRGKTFSRSHFGLPEGKFLFLAMFDMRSVPERKNPLGVVRAFKRAFSGGDDSVGLVVKLLKDTDYSEALLAEINEELSSWKNIVMIDRLLDRDELTSLIDACDCFVSLHRSEGFGLGPAEAMSLGKPAIMTNWSGNTDYMTSDNCVAIDYQLVALGRDYGPYKANQHWAEPDLEQAAHWMKKLVAEPELAKQIGLRGQQTIESQFSPDVVGKIIQARLEQIRSRSTTTTSDLDNPPE